MDTNLPPVKAPSTPLAIQPEDRLLKSGSRKWPLLLALPGLALTVGAADVPPSYTADFEAPAYTLGSIHGQQGWSVEQGRAEVKAEAGRNASAGLVLEPLAPFSQATLLLDTPASAGSPAFLDFYVSPAATDVLRQEEMLDIDGARIGFFRTADAPDLGRFWVFKGDGAGGGEWQATTATVPVDPATGRPPAWVRLTVREDFVRQSWDLWVNGVLAANAAGFQEATGDHTHSYVILGDTIERLILDDLVIGASNPLGVDSDGDGILDADEALLGSNPLVPDRDAPDAAGSTVEQRWMTLLADQANPPPPPLPPVPQFSSSSAVVHEPFSLSLSSSGAAAIFYTMDGSTPGPENALTYTGPITIHSTTVVRACAADASGRVTSVAASAWVFPDQVARQVRPAQWPAFLSEVEPATGGLRQFPLDPQLHFAALEGAPDAASSALVPALEAAPIVVLSVDPSFMFGPEGIYQNSAQLPARKVPGEVIWMDASQTASSPSVRGTLAVSGQSSRSHAVTLKHSLRIVLGESADTGVLFGKASFPTRQFLLRHPTQDSWAVDGAWNSRRAGAKYITDAWASSWLAEAGHDSLTHHWVHVFLNGTYWGVYDAVEQHDADFAARHHQSGPSHLVEPDKENGGTGVRAITGSAAGWLGLLQELRQAAVGGARTTDTAWTAASASLDVPGLIDYVIWNWWLANGDWPNRNWLASFGSGKWSLLSWDAEMALPVDGEVPAVALRLESDDCGPGAAFVLLSQWSAFRHQVAQRLDTLTGEGGALSPPMAATSWEAAAARFRPVALAEAARWGGMYETPGLTAEDWEKAVARVSRKFFPDRAEVVKAEVTGFLARMATQSERPSELDSVVPPVPLAPSVVLALDIDGDRLPDEWELLYGFDPGNPDDALADPDGDGVSNVDEFLRHTHPRTADAAKVSDSGPSIHTRFALHQRRRLAPAAR